MVVLSLGGSQGCCCCSESVVREFLRHSLQDLAGLFKHVLAFDRPHQEGGLRLDRHQARPNPRLQRVVLRKKKKNDKKKD